MENLINLTPHVINIHSNGEILSIPPSGITARVETLLEKKGELFGIDLYTSEYGDVVFKENGQEVYFSDLPKNKYFIVSGMVLAALSSRMNGHFFSPGELVRDENGRPIGCKGLKMV